MKLDLHIEPIPFEEQVETNDHILHLPPLTPEEEEIINPIIPPTSGIRMEILEKKKEGYRMPFRNQCLFLRVFKGIAQVMRKTLQKDQIHVFMASDDRPTADILLEYSARIFAHEGCKLYFQDSDKKDENRFYSRTSAPYASATVALYKEIDLIIMITASHNDLIWNGVKFYVELPIPISGDLMKEVSQVAVSLETIELNKHVTPTYIDANAKNNAYIREMVAELLDLGKLQGNKVMLWPYLGKAPEIQSLMESVGMEVELIEDEKEKPNPTAYIDTDKLENLMNTKQINVAVLLDADRDRVVFYVKNEKTNDFVRLTPNQLYTAMHNILSTEMGLSFLNVRTIPSDPRSDEKACINFITGVGYKHLGMILYLLMDQAIDQSKLNSGILYYKTENGYEKIRSKAEILQGLQEHSCAQEKQIMVLWEESGGHTFNIIDFSDSDGELQITSRFPLIGDKYPAPAILILTTLIEMRYNLLDAIDPDLVGDRTMINANNQQKLEIINYFAKRSGETFTVNDFEYTIGSFETLEGQPTIAYFRANSTEIYLRPSGTGPGMRIYIFGKEGVYRRQLMEIKEAIQTKFNLPQ